MLDTTIQVKTESFDGPLALLLLLIEKEEMNVRELDLTKITKQYLEYLAQMRELNFDVAGDYLFLASTLLLLKSKICITEEEQAKLQDELGVEGFNITSQAELIRRLEELQFFQKMSKKLWELPKKGHEVFVKPKVDRKAIINSILTPMDQNALIMSMVDFLFRQRRKYTVVKRDRLSIKEKLVFLKSNLKVGEQRTLDELLSLDNKSKLNQDADDNEMDPEKVRSNNIVITFISLLELARLKRIEVFQNEDRSTVYINVVKSLEDFDVEQANGFEEEGAAPQDASEKMEAITNEDIKEDKAFIEEVNLELLVAESPLSEVTESEVELPEELLNLENLSSEEESKIIQ